MEPTFVYIFYFLSTYCTHIFRSIFGCVSTNSVHEWLLLYLSERYSCFASVVFSITIFLNEPFIALWVNNSVDRCNRLSCTKTADFPPISRTLWNWTLGSGLRMIVIRCFYRSDRSIHSRKKWTFEHMCAHSSWMVKLL